MQNTPWQAILTAQGVPSSLPRSYAELGLPDDWAPYWEQGQIRDFYDLLATLAEEGWRRTKQSAFDDAVRTAEAAYRRAPMSFEAQTAVEAARDDELAARAGQAALVGWALGQTMQFSSDAETWLQAAMRLAGIEVPPLTATPTEPT